VDRRYRFGGATPQRGKSCIAPAFSLPVDKAAPLAQHAACLRRTESMDPKITHLSERFLRKTLDELSERDRRILRRIAERTPVARDLSQPGTESLGARVADRVATFGGSWTFIFLFFAVLVAWVALNGWLLSRPPDPFPFIFLNLVLSMVAAFQAPIIMMSQNRQALKDREAAANDYEVNLKSELEIMRLHEKLDDLRMVALEQRFTDIEARLDRIADSLTPPAPKAEPDIPI
jgi:uncharacterized membrane protein